MSSDMSKSNLEVYNNIQLLDLASADLIDVEALADIGSFPEIYSRLGMGNPWDIKYLTEVWEQAINDKARGDYSYIHWIVMYQGTVTGYIGLRPVRHGKAGDYQLRIFIDPSKQGQGIATEALRLALDTLHNMDQTRGHGLWSYVAFDNIARLKIQPKVGFIRMGESKIGKDWYARFYKLM